ncbi:MAG: cytidylyltransferase domain-containing protein [Thermodesulfobacteriota bacterium]
METRKNIALIWARGNGSSLPRKSVFPILGKPLISYILQAVRQSGIIDRLYVFTEDQEIMEITQQLGWQIIVRQKHMVEYDDPGFNIQEINHYQNQAILRDLSASPADIQRGAITPYVKGLFHFNCNHCLITATTIRGMYNKLQESDASSICIATKVDPHLFILHGEKETPFPIWHQHGLDRRNYPPLYRLYPDTNYIRIDQLSVNRRQIIYQIPREEALDVHDIADIRLAEFFLTQRNELPSEKS